MDGIDWSEIKVAIWSEGHLTEPLVQNLRMRYRGIKVYLRRKELQRVDNTPSVYAHPDVADFDVGFVKAGDVERIFIRCMSRHRLFPYRPETLRNDPWRRELFLRWVTEALPDLIAPPPTGRAPTAAAVTTAGEDDERGA